MYNAKLAPLLAAQKEVSMSELLLAEDEGSGKEKDGGGKVCMYVGSRRWAISFTPTPIDRV